MKDESKKKFRPKKIRGEPLNVKKLAAEKAKIAAGKAYKRGLNHGQRRV